MSNIINLTRKNLADIWLMAMSDRFHKVVIHAGTATVVKG